MFKNINIKKFAAVTAVIMIASFLISALIFFCTGGVNSAICSNNKLKQNVNMEKTFDSEGINCISVDTSSTDINFIPEDRKDIRVHLTGYISSGKPSLTAELNGDSLNIYTRSKNNMKLVVFGFYMSNLKLDIYLPAEFSKDITIKTSSGVVKVGKLKAENFVYNSSSGDLTGEDFAPKNSIIETSSGSVRLKGFGGDLKLKTSSGDAIVEYSYESNNTSVITSSGAINLKNLTGDLNSRAQSGDVKVDYAKFNNKVNIKSSSGNTDLILPADSQFYIKVNTSSGGIRTDFPVAQSGKIDEYNLEGAAGSSNNQITIKTNSGDVKIIKK